jgi:hypothetical protein
VLTSFSVSSWGPLRCNAVSLEGYVDANVLIAIGLGTPVTFSRSDHQGVHKVWGIQLDEIGHYQPIDLQ